MNERFPNRAAGRIAPTGRCALGLVLSAWTAMASEGSRVEVEFKAWDALSDQHLTPIGESVLGNAKDEWTHAESAHFVIHGKDERVIVKAGHEAEFAWAQSSSWFGDAPNGPKAHLFMIRDSGLWARLLQAHDWPRVSLALDLQDDIFVLRDGSDPFGYIKIPHEIVHLRVHRAFAETCPFWAEEGVAEYLGWLLADRYNRHRYGRALYRTIPPIDEALIRTWDELAALEGYPKAETELLVCERQIQRMVKSMLERLGEEKIEEFIQVFLRDAMPWREGLRSRFGLTDRDLAELEQTSRALLLQEEREGWQPEARADNERPLEAGPISISRP